MGIGVAEGENAAMEATTKAISSPLLEASIDGAKNILLNVTGGVNLSIFATQDASDIVQQAAGTDVNIILGTAIDETLEDEVHVTVVATGIDADQNGKKSPRSQKARMNQQVRNNPVAPHEYSHIEPVSAPVQQEQEPVEDNPFGDWDIRRDNSVRSHVDDAQFQPIEKKELDTFHRDETPKKDDEDDLNTPAFFRRKR
jgi:cell division protein FtsZ